MKTNCFENEILFWNRELHLIQSHLWKEARADRCAGDITTGWDWPTLCAVKPDMAYGIIHAKRRIREAKQALRSAGLL